MTNITEAFDRLQSLMESDPGLDYNLFSEHGNGHTCELGWWGREPGERDITVSASGDTPADAIQAAIAKWEAGEQYKSQAGHHALVNNRYVWHFGDPGECPECEKGKD